MTNDLGPAGDRPAGDPVPAPGKLYGVGVGPGDPELLTRKAARIIRNAHVVAYHAAQHGRSNARRIAAGELHAGHVELPLLYPVTTEVDERTEASYEGVLRAFYDECAVRLAAHLDAGRDVAVLAEGDPFFYGSFTWLHDRLAHRYATEVIPGICSVTAGSARLGLPLMRRDQVLTVLPGTLPETVLASRLADGGAYAIMKVGRNFAKVDAALARAGVRDRAAYIERATTPDERVVPIADVRAGDVPYFSLVLVPGEDVRTEPPPQVAPGRLCVLGLGPGAAEWLSPEARRELHDATDLVGYRTYLDRVPTRPGQRRHATENRVELQRARHAFELAAAGARVCVVSSGDPGIFAMATAVMEALEDGPPEWHALEVAVVPGISAMQAAASRVGAPLGHDFCVISLSDRLKPWETVARRLEAAAAADFALALYNPISSERRRQLGEACAIIARHRAPQTPVVLARDVGGPGERVRTVALADVDPHEVDMRTILLVGASTTRTFPRADGSRFVYTPRTYGVATEARSVAFATER